MASKQDTNASKKQSRLFDIQKESSRITQALEKLKETQKPGELSGMGTKTAILMQNESLIKTLHDSGYTVQQIAKAMSNDSFGILPKSITQLLNKHATSRTKGRKRAVQPAAAKTAQTPVQEPANTNTQKQVTEIRDVE